MVEEKYKKNIISIIRKHIPECKIYLFGSRAKKRSHEGSDIDIAIEAKDKIGRRIIYKIKNEIEETNIPFFVDIIDLKSADKEFKESIYKDLILWMN